LAAYDLQRNFRFSAYYIDLLADLSGQLEISQAEILRRLLELVDDRRAEILKIGQRLVEQLAQRYGRDAEIVFRPADSNSYHVVYIDGKRDDNLIGIHGKGRDGERWRLCLGTRPSSDYEQGLFRQRPMFYVGAIDPDSRAALSIHVSDLHEGTQELRGLLGK
jgi:hypothetical protein